jgi:septal ring factor EnvC (AmiA/AmiB activator)
VAKNRLIALAGALAFSLLLTACGDDKKALQAQVEAQQTQIVQLQAKIDDLRQLHDEINAAASIYEGCTALDGFFSQVCPKSVMVEGKAAVAAGYPGLGWQYWLAYTAKLLCVLIAVSLAALAALRLWLKWIEPSEAAGRAARKTIETAEQQASAAQRAAEAAEDKKWRVERDVEKARRDLAQAHEQIESLQAELGELERQKVQKKQDLDLLGGFS